MFRKLSNGKILKPQKEMSNLAPPCQNLLILFKLLAAE
ncbi:hypothetical protein X975_08592, partial [Stegodyphus mimosarum]